jgi:hypothetical protein
MSLRKQVRYLLSVLLKNIVQMETVPGFSFDRTGDLLFRQSGVHIQILKQTRALRTRRKNNSAGVTQPT